MNRQHREDGLDPAQEIEETKDGAACDRRHLQAGDDAGPSASVTELSRSASDPSTAASWLIDPCFTGCFTGQAGEIPWRTSEGLPTCDYTFKWMDLIGLSVHELKVAILEALQWTGEPLSASELATMLDGPKSGLDHCGTRRQREPAALATGFSYWQRCASPSG